MTVAELIEQLKDQPGDWQVSTDPEYPNAAGLRDEDRIPGRITGFSWSSRDASGGGVVVLSVYTVPEGWPFGFTSPARG